MKTKLSNNVMIYDNKSFIDVFTTLVNEFSILWTDQEFVNVFEDEWMKFSLRDNWQDRISDKVKVYLLDLKDKEVVNKTFDELYQQERLKWTRQLISFRYSVFVVWKTNRDDERKERVVVNIRDLNELLLSDAYSISLQVDVIKRLINCTHISILDAMSFFY